MQIDVFYGLLPRHKKDYTFIYNKSINLFLMERLKDTEVPRETLAENNNYYYGDY